MDNFFLLLQIYFNVVYFRLPRMHECLFATNARMDFLKHYTNVLFKKIARMFICHEYTNVLFKNITRMDFYKTLHEWIFIIPSNLKILNKIFQLI